MCVLLLTNEMNFRATNSTSSRSTLYRLVFGARISTCVLFLLFISFLLQPFHRLQAEELGDGSNEDTSTLEITSSDDELVVSPEIPVPPPETEALVNETNADVQEDHEPDQFPDGEAGADPESSNGDHYEDVSPTATSADLVSDRPDEVVELASTTTISTTTGELSSTTPPEDISGISTDSGSEPTNPEITPGTSSTSPLEGQELSEEIAVPTTTESLPLVHESYSDREVRFLKSDCVQVGNGSYYCQPAGSAASTRDALVAEPDSDGDLEIFLIKDGQYYQLTHNTVDDAAPYYDGRSKTMVWHRLHHNDRYIIMEYDFETATESIVSETGYNEMEPTRFGNKTVWQRWVEDRWHIVLNVDGKETLLTTADAHHLAPHIRGDLVMWQIVTAEGSKHLEIYDLLSGVYTTIDDAEGSAMTNPRMMMVYEAVYENGDVVTRGFDLQTGKVVALDTLPAEVPSELPESESTGEVRALLQNKPHQKEVAVQTGEGESDGPNPLPEPTATSTTELTLDLRSPTTTNDVELLTPTSTDPTFDLVIEPASSTQSIH